VMFEAERRPSKTSTAFLWARWTEGRE
jgi:hypothetical protein